MKVTTLFLSRKIEDIKNIVASITAFSFVMTILICIFMVISKMDNTNFFLYFGTNLRQAQEVKIYPKDFVHLYSIYNQNSYLLKKTQGDKAKQDNLPVYSSEEEKNLNLLDKAVSEENAQTVAAISKTKEANINVIDTDPYQKINIYDMHILNYSSNRNIDIQSLIDKKINLTKKSDKILLYNTHTSESYTNSEKYKFEYSGTYRSVDASYNMISVAKKLKENLDLKFFNVVQNTTPHDYGTYTSAYAKSRVTIKEELEKNGSFGISIDLHRDATSDLSFAPTVNINGVDVAQCMFVIGIGSSSSPNNYGMDNLALAIQLQKIADDYYPGLFRSMIVRNSVYNQDMNNFSILIEIGATGNTLEEAYYSTRCISNILNILYVN